MFKRIDHVAIHVKDLDSSVKFYEHHFGFKHYDAFEVNGKQELRRVCIEGPVFDLQEALGW